MPLDAVFRRVEAVPNPNLGVLLDIVFEVVGLDSAHLNVIPVGVIERPLNVPAFRDFVNPILAARPRPEAPLSLSAFADLVSDFFKNDAEFFDDLSDFLI